MSWLKKGFSITSTGIAQVLEYRTELILWFFLDLLPIGVLIFIWQAIFAHQSELNGFTLTATIQYYFLVFLISTITDVHFETWRCREIRDGKIDFYLVKPFSYLNQIFFRELSSRIVTSAIFLSLFLCFALLFDFAQSKFSIFLFPNLNFQVLSLSFSLTLSQIILVTLLLLSGFLLHFLISLWIVLATFWFEGSQGLEHFKWISVTLFSGSMLPLAFMPEWLQKIVNVLPLKYLHAVPIGVIQQTYNFQTRDMISLILTLSIFGILTIWLWRQAIRQYSSVGG